MLATGPVVDNLERVFKQDLALAGEPAGIPSPSADRLVQVLTTHPGEGIRLGTFFIGRTCDDGTIAEIVAAGGPQVTTPFHGLDSSYIALTNWDPNGNATGSFNILFDDPANTSQGHQFYGRYKTEPCTSLEGTLLP